MSIFDGICKDCFTTSYQLCDGCGQLLRLPRRLTRGAWHPGTREPHDYRDRDNRRFPLCYNCTGSRSDRQRWDPTPLDVSFATYKRITSKRKYGVEIETARCSEYEELQEKTVFGCKSDCSVSGLEFVSPVLYGDEGLAEIEGFLVFAEENDWEVDYDCGCHTHYDVRDETDEELLRITYAYAKSYRFWSRCVSSARRRNSYCHEPAYTTEDVRRHADRGVTFDRFWNHFDRYDYVNVAAWHSHRTFEVRLLEGSVDPTVICNWVTIHCRFMDYVKRLSFDDLDVFLSGNTEHVLSAIAIIVADTDGNSYLSDWLTERIQSFLD